MRHQLLVVPVAAILIAATVGAQRSKVAAPASAQSVLYLVADTERELTRLPARFARMSDADEIAAGDAIVAANPLPSGKISADDATVEAYVQVVGRRVAAHANRKLPYRFHYVPDRDFVNAFAVPGGHVFIGGGLLDRMNSEDELAAVLAHEIEHIDHYHCAERWQLERALDKVATPVVSIPVTVFQAGYSKAEESEADGEGIHLAARAGYSAAGMLQILETYDRLYRFVTRADRTPQDEMTRVAIDALLGYFASHPPTTERIARVKAMMARDPSLASRPVRPLDVQYIILARRAADAVAKSKFSEAALLASQSVQTKSDYAPALMALTEAEFGRQSVASAQAAYRALIELDSNSAAAVQTWLLSFADLQIAHGHAHDAVIDLQAFLDVQANDPKALRTLTLALALDGRAVEAVAAASTLKQMYPEMARDAETSLRSTAATLLSENDFDRAAILSRACVALQPASIRALTLLGDAEFARANFTEAARAYAEAVAIAPDNASLLESFTESAAAASPDTAVHDLEKITPQLKTSEALIRTELAGLALLAGDDTPAREVRAAVQSGAIPPEMLARLGWWYFRADRIAESRRVLGDALQRRPGNSEAQSSLAWAEIAADSSGRETTLAQPPQSITRSSDAARDAIAMWQRGKQVAAVDAWRVVVHADPQWSNEKWREAIYPATIASLASQIEHQRLLQDAARKAHFQEWLAARKAMAGRNVGR